MNWLNSKYNLNHKKNNINLYIKNKLFLITKILTHPLNEKVWIKLWFNLKLKNHRLPFQ